MTRITGKIVFPSPPSLSFSLSPNHPLTRQNPAITIMTVLLRNTTETLIFSSLSSL